MNKIYIADKYLYYLEENEKLEYYEYEKLEIDIEDFQIKKDNIVLIFDHEISNFNYYITILKKNDFKIKKATSSAEILKKLNINMYIIGTKQTMIVNNTKIEYENIGIDDNLDFEGIDYMIVNEEFVLYIFEKYNNVNAKSVIKVTINEKMLVIISITAYFIITFTTSIYFDISKLESRQITIKDKLVDLLNKKNNLSDTLINIENEIHIKRENKSFITKLAKNNYSKLIKDLVELNEFDIFLSEYSYKNNISHINGIASDYNLFVKKFENYKILNIKMNENVIEFEVESINEKVF